MPWQKDQQSRLCPCIRYTLHKQITRNAIGTVNIQPPDPSNIFEGIIAKLEWNKWQEFYEKEVSEPVLMRSIEPVFLLYPEPKLAY